MLNLYKSEEHQKGKDAWKQGFVSLLSELFSEK